jgi:hypothetical protein
MMQYLTPELLARFRSPDDDVAEDAAREWDQAIANYNAELRAIRSFLPMGVRALLARWSLHDATILSIALARRKPRLSLVIQLEGSRGRPGEVLELQYSLARTARNPGFSLIDHAGHGKDRQDKARIQYDEFRKVVEDPVEVFSHSLLLKGFYELQIWFTDMQVRQLQRVIFPSLEQLGTALA